MEQQQTQLPVRAADLLKAQADRLIMLCYEQENGVNCHGYTPQPHKGPDYIRAKSAALKIAKKYKDYPLWDLLKSAY